MINFKEQFAINISKILNKDKDEIFKFIEQPPDFSLGDLSFPCFSLSKELKKSPQDIAKELTEKLQKEKQDTFEYFSVNGYINLRISHNQLYKETITEVLKEKENYGKPKIITKEQYVIDTFNANPFKTLHVGHLRMIVGGDSISRLLAFSGYDPKPVYYGGDVGTHVAKWYWYYTKYLTDKQREIPKTNVAKWFGEIYLKAGEKAKSESNSTEEIDELQKEILTNRDLQITIAKLRDSCFQAYMQVKDELKVTLIDKIFESESEKKFLEIKDDLIKKHKDVITESQDAVIADLKDQKLDVIVLIKKNGAPLYGAKDIALVQVKQQKFPKCNHFIYVVGAEQDFYFKQLFALFSDIYPNTTHEHISLGMVNLSTGKMASRAGGMILYEDLRDMLKEKAKEILIENNLEIDNEIINKIVFGTIKFEMLKIGFNKTFVFDINSALDLQGDSSVYVQYSGVRAKSILRKVSAISDTTEIKPIQLEDDEHKLLNLIYQFSNKVEYATKERKPNIIASYCLDLSHTFNKFYTNCQVINEAKNIKNQRLLLIKAYLQCLENALDLLGIEIPEKM
ncbi:MAG: arginine--tRNA ligase [archaeon]|jgi:arginyl-tRNA synthetase